VHQNQFYFLRNEIFLPLLKIFIYSTTYSLKIFYLLYQKFMVTIKEINFKQAKVCFLLDSQSLRLWSLKQWQSELNKDNVKALAVFKDEKIIGVCVFQMILDEAELNYMAIHPEFLRKGFGQILFSEFLSISGKYNVRKIFLEVSANNVSAINFYESFNFKTIRVREKYYKDGSDAILKAKVIC
tara:strand:- start:11110 stop:11661 length:552 start_codon:yes stop_codon:yes gene_type:complete